MIKAPERILAVYAPEIAEDNEGATIVAYETAQHGGAEYVRADIHAATVARAEKAEAERDALAASQGRLIDDTVSMGMARDEAISRAEKSKAALAEAVAAERERCAAVVRLLEGRDMTGTGCQDAGEGYDLALSEAADAILARAAEREGGSQ